MNWEKTQKSANFSIHEIQKNWRIKSSAITNLRKCVNFVKFSTCKIHKKVLPFANDFIHANFVYLGYNETPKHQKIFLRQAFPTLQNLSSVELPRAEQFFPPLEGVGFVHVLFFDWTPPASPHVIEHVV